MDRYDDTGHRHAEERGRRENARKERTSYDSYTIRGAAHIYSRTISFYETSMRIVTSVPFMYNSQGDVFRSIKDWG